MGFCYGYRTFFKEESKFIIIKVLETFSKFSTIRKKEEEEKRKKIEFTPVAAKNKNNKKKWSQSRRQLNLDYTPDAEHANFEQVQIWAEITKISDIRLDTFSNFPF